MNVCVSVNYGCTQWVLQKGHKQIEISVCACVCVCMGRKEEIKGRRRGSVREWVEGKDREAVEKEREKKGVVLIALPLS